MGKRSTIIITMILLCTASGCGPLRTEFYRAETKHLYEVACDFYKEGDYQRAAAHLDRVIVLDPNYGAAYATQAHLKLLEEDYQAASQLYQEAITRDPELKPVVKGYLALIEIQLARQPLEEAGIDLAFLHQMLMDEHFDALATRLNPETPYDLLARDTLTLNTHQRKELIEQAAVLHNRITDNQIRLLFAHLFFHNRSHESETTILLAQLAESAEPGILQHALMLQGRVHERHGNPAAAIDSYLAAMDSGLPVEQISPALARMYGTDLDTVLEMVRNTKTTYVHVEPDNNTSTSQTLSFQSASSDSEPDQPSTASQVSH